MNPLRSLRWRLALLSALVVAAALGAVLAAVSLAVERELIDTTAGRLEVSAGLIGEARTGQGPPRIDLAADEVVQILGGQGTAVAILDPTGATLASADNGVPADVAGARLDRATYAAIVDMNQTRREVLTGSGARVLVVVVPISLAERGKDKTKPAGSGSGGGPPFVPPGQAKQGGGAFATADGPPNAVAQLATSLERVDAALADLRLRLVEVGAGVLVVAIVGAALLTRLALRPLDRVTATADRVAAGDLSARVGPAGATEEVVRLGRAFDGMAERVEATFRAERQFAADASHELRSPLTILGGYVDVLALGAATDPDERARILDAMRAEIDRLSRLSADLLLLTQLEAGGGRLDARSLDLAELVADLGEAARVLDPTRRIDVGTDGPVVVRADHDRLTQALLNLVDNALRHSPPDGVVRLSTGQGGGAATVTVWNDGTPIPPDELPRLFDRFYRGSRTGRADRPGEGHAGLGLAIARAIVEASGGTIEVASDAAGTRFTVRLPLVR